MGFCTFRWVRAGLKSTTYLKPLEVSSACHASKSRLPRPSPGLQPLPPPPPPRHLLQSPLRPTQKLIQRPPQRRSARRRRRRGLISAPRTRKPREAKRAATKVEKSTTASTTSKSEPMKGTSAVSTTWQRCPLCRLAQRPLRRSRPKGGERSSPFFLGGAIRYAPAGP